MAKSIQAQINELKRTVEKYHIQHKLLKSKVTELATRLRGLEPFSYARDRDLFYIYVEEFIKVMEEYKKTTT